jgi:hypothetical protein
MQWSGSLPRCLQSKYRDDEVTSVISVGTPDGLPDGSEERADKSEISDASMSPNITEGAKTRDTSSRVEELISWIDWLQALQQFAQSLRGFDSA